MNRLPAFVMLLVLSVATLGVSACNSGEFIEKEEQPDDQVQIDALFDPEYPGYSDVRVLSRRGHPGLDPPRVLTLQVTLASYPDNVIGEGELSYFYGEESYLNIGWYSLEYSGHALLVHWARRMLRPQVGPDPCQPRFVALLLRRWIDEGWIGLDDITYPGIRQRVEDLPADPSGSGTSSLRNAGLFSTYDIQTYDLAPELADDEKDEAYVLYCDGTLELFLRTRTQGLNLPIGAIVVASPIPRPSEGQ